RIYWISFVLISECSSIERNVDVFGKTSNCAISFRERCTTLEHKSRHVRFWEAEQTLECPAHPKVLLNNRIREAASRASLIEENSAFFRGQACNFVHSLNLQARHTAQGGPHPGRCLLGSFCQGAAIRWRKTLCGSINHGRCGVWSQVTQCLNKCSSRAARG